MDTPGDPPPEGRLIEDARQALPGMSQNKAATLAGMSGTRWRQIVTGIASGGKGIQIPVHGNAETLARMARAVGVTPDQLSAVDRDDAARELRRLPPLNADREPTATELAMEMRAIRLEIQQLREQDRKQDEEIKELRKRESS